MQSVLKTCLAVALLTASASALEVEKRGGGRGGGRGRGRFSCNNIGRTTGKMGDHCDGDADCEALVDTFEADIGILCDDLEDAEQGWKDAYEDVKVEACLTWCAIKNT